MKKISIITILVSSFLSSASLSHEEITEMITKIKEERVGISLEKLENTANPFIINKKKKVVKKIEKEEAVEVRQEVDYKLHAILNHAAFINGKWYKRGDKLGLYHIVYIGKHSVDIRSEFGNKRLHIKKRENKFMNLNKGKN
jgi:hypothetical protein